MKKTYQKPEAKKVSFQYEKVLAASAICDQGWTKETTLVPELARSCARCYKELIWLGSVE